MIAFLEATAASQLCQGPPPSLTSRAGPSHTRSHKGLCAVPSLGPIQRQAELFGELLRKSGYRREKSSGRGLEMMCRHELLWPREEERSSWFRSYLSWACTNKKVVTFQVTMLQSKGGKGCFCSRDPSSLIGTDSVFQAKYVDWKTFPEGG